MKHTESLFCGFDREDISNSPEIKNIVDLNSMKDKSRPHFGLNSEIFNDKSSLFDENEHFDIITEEPSEHQKRVLSLEKISGSSSTIRAENETKLETRPIQIAYNTNQVGIPTQIKKVSSQVITVPQLVQAEPKNIMLPVLNVLRPVRTMTIGKMPEKKITPQLVSQSFNSPAVKSIMSFNQSLTSSASSNYQKNSIITSAVVPLTKVVTPLNANDNGTKILYIKPNTSKVLIKKN
jgi:hypothetical protein